MKRFILIVVAILVALALIITSLTVWLRSGNKRLVVNDFRLEQLEQEKLNIDNLTKVKLALRSAKVVVKQAPEAGVILQNYVPSQFDIQQHGESLTITQKNSKQRKWEIGEYTTIVLMVKEDLTNLNIQQLNGTLRLENIATDTLNIAHDNGTTLLQKVTVKEQGTIEKKNGTTTLNNLIAPGLRVSVKTGTFTLNDVKEKNNYDDQQPKQLRITSGTGQVVVTRK